MDIDYVSCTPLSRKPTSDSQGNKLKQGRESKAPGRSHGVNVTQTCQTGSESAGVAEVCLPDAGSTGAAPELLVFRLCLSLPLLLYQKV